MQKLQLHQWKLLATWDSIGCAKRTLVSQWNWPTTFNGQISRKYQLFDSWYGPDWKLSIYCEVYVDCDGNVVTLAEGVGGRAVACWGWGEANPGDKALVVWGLSLFNCCWAAALALNSAALSCSKWNCCRSWNIDDNVKGLSRCAKQIKSYLNKLLPLILQSLSLSIHDGFQLFKVSQLDFKFLHLSFH